MINCGCRLNRGPIRVGRVDKFGSVLDEGDHHLVQPAVFGCVKQLRMQVILECGWPYSRKKAPSSSMCSP